MGHESIYKNAREDFPWKHQDWIRIFHSGRPFRTGNRMYSEIGFIFTEAMTSEGGHHSARRIMSAGAPPQRIRETGSMRASSIKKCRIRSTARPTRKSCPKSISPWERRNIRICCMRRMWPGGRTADITCTTPWIL